MANKSAEGRLTIYLRGGGTIELPKRKVEITYGGFHKVESIVFSNDGSPEIIHLNTDEVIAVTVAKPSERRARATPGSYSTFSG